MSKISEEKRVYPRVKTNLEINISKGISGNSVDLSEGGLSFNSGETISSPVMSLQIHFPDRDREFKTKAKLAWKRNLNEGGSVYGVEFVGLKETQKAVLREELIKSQIRGLLNEVKDSEAKKHIFHFFLKDMLDYVNEVVRLIPHLSKEGEYSLELEKKIDYLNNQILLKGYSLDVLLSDRRIMQRVKDNFRQLIGTWVYKSAIVKRAFDKPRGYPGDYKMLETIYNNKPISKNIGVYFDNNFLKSPYAVAVRIRKDRLRDMLRDFIETSKAPSVKILNLACGSSREIAELLPSLNYKNPLIFTCIDWDEEALEFSKKRLQDIPQNVKFNFLKEDILGLIKDEKYIDRLGQQDLVYSIGLIDYLPDRILKRWLQFFCRLLPKGGKFIITHKNREKTFPPLPPEWFCDWKFIPRNKQEVVDLLNNCGINDFSLEIDADNFNYIFYFILTKKQ